MEIRNHVYIRYCERFLNMKNVDEKEIKKYIFENKKDLTNKILELKEKSRLVWTGTVADQTMKNFYLYDNIILVESIDINCLITIYILDYGFCSEKVNREIIKTLLNEMNKAEIKINKYKEKIEKILPQKECKLSVVNEEINAVEEQLEILKNKKKLIEDDIKLSNDELRYLVLERDKIARQLVTSINLKMDALKEKNGGK